MEEIKSVISNINNDFVSKKDEKGHLIISTNKSQIVIVAITFISVIGYGIYYNLVEANAQPVDERISLPIWLFLLAIVAGGYILYSMKKKSLQLEISAKEKSIISKKGASLSNIQKFTFDAEDKISLQKRPNAEVSNSPRFKLILKTTSEERELISAINRNKEAEKLLHLLSEYMGVNILS